MRLFARLHTDVLLYRRGADGWKGALLTQAGSSDLKDTPAQATVALNACLVRDICKWQAPPTAPRLVVSLLARAWTTEAPPAPLPGMTVVSKSLEQPHDGCADLEVVVEAGRSQLTPVPRPLLVHVGVAPAGRPDPQRPPDDLHLRGAW